MKKNVFVNGKEYELDLQNQGNKKIVIIKNRKFEVEIIPRKIKRKMFAIINGEGVEFFVFKKGKDRYAILINGKEYEVEMGRRREKREEEGMNFVYAPMPGIITGVKVKKGERVKKDTPLMTMESMKMQIEISSPADGEIEKIFVNEGSSVKKGDKLLNIKNE